MKTISKIGNRQGLFLLAAVFCISVSGVVYPQGINRRAGGAAERLTPTDRRPNGAAAERPTQADRRPNREAAAAEKNQQLQAEATPAIQAMSEQIKELLTMVNEMRRPDPARMTIADQTLKESGRFVRKFDQNIQCEYNLLDSWLKYFKNDIPGAAISAATAFKNDPDNNDAKITFAAMSILSGRRPTGVVAKREPPMASDRNDRNSPEARRQMVEQQRNRTRPGETTEQLLTAAVSTGNILQVDINALNLELFEQKVPALQAQCVNSTNFSYSPGQSGLCLLFWQVRPKTFVPTAAPASGEPNQPGAAPRPSQRNPAPTVRRDTMNSGDNVPTDRRGGMAPRGRTMDSRMTGMSDSGYSATTPGYGATGTRSTIESETAALGQLFLAHYADSDLKFLGVNTDNAAAKKDAVASIVQNPTPWAQVFASDPQSGLSQFAKVDAESPILAIADKTGTIRYAGPAAGFLAPMILDHLGGIGSSVPSATPAPATPAAPKPAAPVAPAAPKPQPAVPAAPATPAPKLMSSASLEDIEPTEEELIENPSLYEAAKKVEFAKTLFIPSGQKRFMTSKNGVETCREILRRWPNTKYAEQARQLLRKIPEDEQKRYKITNEELGL
jgi:hypothetical protein